ncbi:MAG: ThuA domain-containing protein [Candidatus Marinimicrobia bacterium]|nr:ThuA domain-containing protein [Candidatus Neomarinimicrobiota bacterium]
MEFLYSIVRKSVIALMLIGLAYTGNVAAQDNINVLIVTGGHDFNRTAFFEMFHDMDGITFHESQHPKANDMYGSPMADLYDVFVFYDMYDQISDSQKEDLVTLLEEGKGMVFLHHSLVSYQDWDEFADIIGGKYHRSEEVFRGEPVDASSFKHDVEVQVEIADKQHPVTRGLSSFTMTDEVYGGFSVMPDVHPLLKTDHPASTETIAWTHHYENSRIIYIQPGHDEKAFENTHYRNLVRNAIKYTAESPLK